MIGNSYITPLKAFNPFEFKSFKKEIKAIAIFMGITEVLSNYYLDHSHEMSTVTDLPMKWANGEGNMIRA